MPAETELLTTIEAAERIGMSVRWVKARIASGELRSVKLGGARRVEVSAVEEFIARRRTVDPGGGERR